MAEKPTVSKMPLSFARGEVLVKFKPTEKIDTILKEAKTELIAQLKGPGSSPMTHRCWLATHAFFTLTCLFFLVEQGCTSGSQTEGSAKGVTGVSVTDEGHRATDTIQEMEKRESSIPEEQKIPREAPMPGPGPGPKRVPFEPPPTGQTPRNK